MPPTWILLLSLMATSHAKMEGFIVGGKFAKIDFHAHSAFLSIKCASFYGKVSNWICGASVVNQKILLTAAHCLHECEHKSFIKANLGNANRQQGQKHSIHSFVNHEYYSPVTSANDVSLVRTLNNIIFNPKVTRVALMPKPPYTENANVAGWGMVDEILEKQNDKLKSIQQKVLSHINCLKIFRYLSVGTICAKANDSSEYAAQGDSGSALTVRGYIQIGLVSYKVPSIARHIVVFTDVGVYYHWIKYYSKLLSCQRDKPSYSGYQGYPG